MARSRNYTRIQLNVPPTDSNSRVDAGVVANVGRTNGQTRCLYHAMPEAGATIKHSSGFIFPTASLLFLSR